MVGVEDGGFQKGVTRKAPLIAVLLKGFKINDVKLTKVTVDGLDATERLMEILKNWDFETIMLAGVSFAGFNLIDPITLYEGFGKPVIIISQVKPNNEAVKRALQRHFKDWQVRWAVFEKLGPIHEVAVSSSGLPVYIETVGTNIDWANSIVKRLSVHGKTPEPIRVARLIARGISQLKGITVTPNVCKSTTGTLLGIGTIPSLRM